VAAGVTDWTKLRTQPVTVFDSISADLERLILNGEIAVGARLPPERELASLLGVSRPSLREALRELELKGLIDRRPGRGTIVGDPHRATLSGGLLALVDLPERTLLEIMDLRAAIEPPIAARAAGRATRGDFRGLEKVLARMDEETDPQGTAEIDVEFHYRIARAAHNPLLVKLVELTSEWMKSSRHRGFQTTRRRSASIAGHREILAAIKRHDPDGAAVAMAEHIQEVTSILSEDLPRARGQPPRKRSRKAVGGGKS
jgi:GntR family transcriptional repressor for pyruvate dehydrogenase complex